MTQHQPSGRMSRRQLLAAGCATGVAGVASESSVVADLELDRANHSLRVSELEVFPVRLPRNRK